MHMHIIWVDRIEPPECTHLLGVWVFMSDFFGSGLKVAGLFVILASVTPPITSTLATFLGPLLGTCPMQLLGIFGSSLKLVQFLVMHF